MQAATKQVLDALKELGSATVYNAVVYSMGGTPDGLTRKVEGGQPENYTGPEVHCMLPELGPVAGYAVTAEITSNDPDTPGVPWDDYHEALARETAPTIAVIKDADSRPGRGAAFGDDMAGRYKAFGAVGVIVDGSVRDLEGIEEVGMPTWGGGRVPGHGVFTLVRVNAPVTVAQLRIGYGDLLVADSDGLHQDSGRPGPRGHPTPRPGGPGARAEVAGALPTAGIRHGAVERAQGQPRDTSGLSRPASGPRPFRAFHSVPFRSVGLWDGAARCGEVRAFSGVPSWAILCH